MRTHATQALTGAEAVDLSDHLDLMDVSPARYSSFMLGHNMTSYDIQHAHTHTPHNLA